MTKPPVPAYSFWALVACMLVLMALRLNVARHRRGPVPDAAAVQVVPVGPSSPATASRLDTTTLAGRQFVGPTLDAAGWCVVQDTLEPHDSVYLSLRRHAVPDRQIVALTGSMAQVFSSRRESRPGDLYTLTTDSSGTIQRFEYVPVRKPERPVLVRRRDGALHARRLQLPLSVQTVTLTLQLEDNLSHAVHAAGELDALTDVLTDDVFGAVINFRRDPRRGDTIRLLFEKQYRDQTFIRYGRLLAAQYDGQIVSTSGFAFADDAGNLGFYDAAGRSLERQFLLYALPYRGITSRFNRKRFHPVLKRVIPHLGTDYAASTGTSVWATGRGLVTYAGWKGALGKAVIVEHPNGYTTRYGHLSRILVKQGQRVEQKQLIGRVGATGRVTGPHLHYEIIKDGHHLNPATINRGTRGKPLTGAALARFHRQRDSLLTRLASARPVAASLPR